MSIHPPKLYDRTPEDSIFLSLSDVASKKQVKRLSALVQATETKIAQILGSDAYVDGLNNYVVMDLHRYRIRFSQRRFFIQFQDATDCPDSNGHDPSWRYLRDYEGAHEAFSMLNLPEVLVKFKEDVERRMIVEKYQASEFVKDVFEKEIADAEARIAGSLPREELPIAFVPESRASVVCYRPRPYDYVHFGERHAQGKDPLVVLKRFGTTACVVASDDGNPYTIRDASVTHMNGARTNNVDGGDDREDSEVAGV